MAESGRGPPGERYAWRVMSRTCQGGISVYGRVEAESGQPLALLVLPLRLRRVADLAAAEQHRGDTTRSV